MIYDDSRIEREHRANLLASAPVSLIPKRCVCGKACRAKQLAQYGKCAGCLLDARVATLAPADIDMLKHALGATQHRPKRSWGFRNYFCAGGGPQTDAMLRLVAAGFATQGHTLERGSVYFHATKDGCKLAGLDYAGVKRAIEDQS